MHLRDSKFLESDTKCDKCWQKKPIINRRSDVIQNYMSCGIHVLFTSNKTLEALDSQFAVVQSYPPGTYFTAYDSGESVLQTRQLALVI